ncbi:hypothetical protein N865_07170 [Intrasporangium oryzae NRRL B-24470]|uniref:Cytochrome b561 domain-containing protein n=1 Tax=Intrasporangium oryzae NRRL B-24470 TaxID=1386089 RepID=W9G7S8_9MICO|nr:DUF6529 family protein [Intrasporangium oryzae]EWT02065.1 hypothetical protein N865_07170 [Intrasporangium oryzae NRRL B-24470]
MADTTAQKGMAVPLAAFAAGAVVALLIGVFGAAHQPTASGTTALGFQSVIDMKVVLSTVIGVLALLQIVGALWLYGRLGIAAPSWLGMAHRVTGVVAIVMTTFVAYTCLWALGLQTGQGVSTRTVVHGILGCAVFGAVVVKVVAVRSRRAPGWLIPVAGGLLFAVLIGVVLTSAVWYIAQVGWPGSGTYG